MGREAKQGQSHFINEEVGYLRPHSPVLKAGDVQKMCFQDDDEGPYYASFINQQLHRYDEVRGKKIKKFETRLCRRVSKTWTEYKGKNNKGAPRNGTKPKNTYSIGRG